MTNIFKVAFKKGQKHLLKINMNGEDVWANTVEEVYNFAKANFADGDAIGMEYTKKGKLYHITRINKDGKNTEIEGDSVVEEGVVNAKDPVVAGKEFTCIDCGKRLKNGTYKKCYACNEKNPVKNTNTSYTRSPETVASIKMQCAYKAACSAILVFTGQIDDLATLKSQLDDLANHIVKNF